MTNYPMVILFILLLSTFAKAQEPISPNGKFADVNGAKIYYEEYGQGEPLILLHGFGRTASDWQLFIQDLSKHYRVIAWDMRGHGRSTSPDTSVVSGYSKCPSLHCTEWLALTTSRSLKRL